MTTDLTIAPPATPIPSDAEARSMFALAETLASSGLFKDTRQAEQAFAKILFGRDLGLGATQAMTGVDIIEGKPSLSANLQAAMLRQYRSPEGARYDYRVNVSAAGCEGTVYRVDADGTATDVGSTRFGPDEAKAAGLAGGKNYQKYAANMYFARWISNAVAWFAPEVTFGTRTFGEGELTGELVNPSPLPSSVLPTPEPAPVAERAVVGALRSMLKAKEATVADLDAALDELGVPRFDHHEPAAGRIGKRISVAPDEALERAVVLLGERAEIVDAQVVQEIA